MLLYWILLPIVWPLLHILWRIEVVGKENIPRGRAHVIASNHLSDLDPVYILEAVFSWKRYTILAKQELFFTHQTPFYTGDLSNMDESDGTNRMYGLSALLYTMVKNQQILVCDELDSSLHYDLFTHILKTFLVNSERGQLIFSTHNLMLLDEEYIRRDMVYFANKNQSGATEVYRAKDFGLHKEVSILNAYRAGKLGAKPNMGSIFMND